MRQTWGKVGGLQNVEHHLEDGFGRSDSVFEFGSSCVPGWWLVWAVKPSLKDTYFTKNNETDCLFCAFLHVLTVISLNLTSCPPPTRNAGRVKI